jgi:hypothetical protein
MEFAIICILLALLLFRSGGAVKRRAARFRLNLTCDAEAVLAIERLKEATGLSDAEVLKHAIALYEWSRVHCATGYTVGSFKEGLPAREVTLPFALPPPPPSSSSSSSSIS